MMDPNNLRAVMQMQQSLQQLNSSGLMPGVPPMGGSAPPPPAGGLDFSSLLGSSGGTPAAAPPMANPFMFPFMPPAAGQQQPGNAAGNTGSASQQQAPGQRFRQQLQNLNDMGFTDRSANIRALTSSHGNVNRAIEILLESPPEMGESSSESAAATGEGETTTTSNDDTSDETSSDPKEATEKKND